MTSTKDLAEIKNCSASGNIGFTVNGYEPNETSKELEGKIVNYVGGIAGTAQDIVIFKRIANRILILRWFQVIEQRFVMTMPAR